MSTRFALLAAEAEEHAWILPMPAWAYGAIALAVALLLLGIVWTFRNMGHTLMNGPEYVDHHAVSGGGAQSGAHGSGH